MLYIPSYLETGITKCGRRELVYDRVQFLISRFQIWDPMRSCDLAALSLSLVVAILRLELRSINAYISLFPLHFASLFFAFHLLDKVLKSFYFFVYLHVKILIQTSLSWDVLFPIYFSFKEYPLKGNACSQATWLYSYEERWTSQNHFFITFAFLVPAFMITTSFCSRPLMQPGPLQPHPSRLESPLVEDVSMPRTPQIKPHIQRSQGLPSTSFFSSVRYLAPSHALCSSFFFRFLKNVVSSFYHREFEHLYSPLFTFRY